MSIVRRRTKADLSLARGRRQTGTLNRSTATENEAIPVDLPRLRTSERSSFRRCRWKWWWEFEENIKPKQDIPALRFGNLIHLALAAYYPPGRKRGPRPWITFEKVYEEECKLQESFGFRVQEDEKWAEAGELGPAMLKHYVEHYTSGIPTYPDDEFEVLVTEQRFKTLVRHPDTGAPWFWYLGILDGIWKHLPTGRLHVVDHKTTAAIVLKYLSLDPQATAYLTWGLDWIYEQGLLPPTERPGGMLFNLLRKQFPDERKKNERGESLNLDGAVSKQQPAPYFSRVPIYRDWSERETARTQVAFEYHDMEMVRAAGEARTEDETGQPPNFAYKNQGQFNCTGCWVFDICELHEIGADHDELIQLTTRENDPYDQYNIEYDERR